MAYEKDSNKKHPLIKFTGRYPNIYVTQGIDGYQNIRSLEPGSEAFFEIFTSGSYRSHGPSGEEVRVTMGKKHEYGADGASSTFDGHVDEKIGATKRSNVDGSRHAETAGNISEAGGGVKIEGIKDSKIEAQTKGDKYGTTKGNVVTEHTGNVHTVTIGDVVNVYKGNFHETVSDGDAGINVQQGSLDTKINAGKMRYDVAQNISIISHDQINMLVDKGAGTISAKALTKITLEVGGSKIEISEGGIKMTAPRIDLN